MKLDVAIQNQTGDSSVVRDLKVWIEHTGGEAGVALVASEGGIDVLTAFTYEPEILPNYFDSLADYPDQALNLLNVSANSSSNRFTFSIAQSFDPVLTPDVTFTLHLWDRYGNTWDFPITIPVTAATPEIVLAPDTFGNQYDIYDGQSDAANGNGDGFANPGETVKLDVAIQNQTGDLSVVRDLKAWIEHTGPEGGVALEAGEGGVDELTSFLFEPEILPNYFDSIGDYPEAALSALVVNADNSSNRYTFTIDPGFDPGTTPTITFTLHFKDRYGNTWDVPVVIPVIPLPLS